MRREQKIDAPQADGKTPDRFGVIWPEGYVVCPECGQPDNTGDCNHRRLTSDDVVELMVGILDGSLWVP